MNKYLLRFILIFLLSYMGIFICYRLLILHKQEAVYKQLVADIGDQIKDLLYKNINFNIQNKGWHYNAEVWLEIPSGASQADLTLGVLKAVEACKVALEKSSLKDQLFYDSSNLYLYTIIVKSGRDFAVILDNGILKSVQYEYFLREYPPDRKPELHIEERKPTLLWEKRFEEALEELNIANFNIKRDPQEVFDFSSDPEIRRAVIQVRERIFKNLKEEGYNNFVSFQSSEFALKNASGPIDWVFALTKTWDRINKRKTNIILFDEGLYLKEYKQLHEKILTMINEAPELKPFLKSPINPKNLRLGIWYNQCRYVNDNIQEVYDHFVFQSPTAFVMKRNYSPNSVFFYEEEKIISLEKLYEYMRI